MTQYPPFLPQVNIPDEKGWTPLHIACQDGDRDMAATLLEAGADPNGPLYDGTTPLYIAAMCGHPKLVESFYLIVWVPNVVCQI